MRRNSHSCGVLVFMFYGEIELFREKKDDNGKYYMRTVIALVSYVIIAISPSSRLSSRPILLVPSVSLSLMRLVYASRISSRSRYCPNHVSVLTLLPLSFVITLIRSISIPSRHGHEPATVNMNKNELEKTARPHQPRSPSPAEPIRNTGTERHRPNHMMTRTSTPRPARAASPPRMAARAKRDGMRTRRLTKRDTRRRNGTRHHDEIHDKQDTRTRNAHDEMLQT